MDFAEVASSVHEIETEYSLFEKPLDGSSIWELIRGQIWHRAREEFVDSGSVDVSREAEGQSRLHYSLSLMRSLRLKRNPFVNSRDVILFGFVRRRKREDGNWWDVVLDPLLSDFSVDLSWSYIEPPIAQASGLHYNKVKTPSPNRVFGDIFQTLPAIISEIPVLSPTLSQTARQRLAEVEQAVENRVGIGVALREHANRIYPRHKFKQQLYRLLYRRHKPRAVVVAGNYPTAISTAQDLGIITIEVQHGTINRYQPRFAYPDGVQPHSLSEHHLVWGPGWIGEHELPANRRLHPIGYAYAADERARIRQHVGEDLPLNQIVVISQFFVGRRLVMIADELSQRLPDTQVVFKPHPSIEHRWQSVYEELIDSSVSVTTSEDKPLYQLFAESVAQVGVSSTAIFEGLQFELQTFIIDEFTSDYCEQLITNEEAYCVTDAAEISELYEGKREDHDSSKYFQPSDGNPFPETLSQIISEY